MPKPKSQKQKTKRKRGKKFSHTPISRISGGGDYNKTNNTNNNTK